jgi:hypothetical protein
MPWQKTTDYPENGRSGEGAPPDRTWALDALGEGALIKEVLPCWANLPMHHKHPGGGVMVAHAFLAVTAATAEKGALQGIGTASYPSPSARSDVSWHT